MAAFGSESKIDKGVGLGLGLGLVNVTVEASIRAADLLLYGHIQGCTPLAAAFGSRWQLQTPPPLVATGSRSRGTGSRDHSIQGHGQWVQA